MNSPRKLHIELLSDATFGRGEGTAGEVDTEVEHDEFGIPFVGGKAVRGLLRDTWLSMRPHFPELRKAGDRVFGPTKRFLDVGVLRVGDALLQREARDWLIAAATRADERDCVSPAMILAACTDIRYQTAEDRLTGAPAPVTLHSSRVVLRTSAFEAPLTWRTGDGPEEDDLRVLAMAALATRHGGLMRNRGRGQLRISLDGDLEWTRRLAGIATSEATR
ncbi:MAG: RAMP superfamily protein [Planctomycetota bacterium]|nr:RAMP superfamily protein [Planctomycetota bacterium]